VWDYLFKGDAMFETVCGPLRERWPGVEFVGPEPFGNIHGPDERQVVEDLPRRLREQRVDAAIVGVGACGSCTPAVMRAVAAAERIGVPAVGLVSSGFATQAGAVGTALGLPTVRLATYPGVILTDDEATIVAKSREHLLPAVIESFVGSTGAASAPAAEAAAAEYRPREIVFSGTLDEVHDLFEERLWSDGLPIVPPTPDRVEAALAHTDRAPDEVLGVLLPESREATVYNVAVNGVMAGCRPEYLPVLIAAVEAIADPRFRVEDAGCTVGWEPMIIVSGPGAERLGFNTRQGALRVGVRANTSIGRFLRLYLRNVAGLRIPPGQTDKATLGATFNVALAEDEAAVAELGWPTMRDELGFGPSETVVAVQSVAGSSLPIYSSGATPDRHLDIIAQHIAGASGHWAFLGVKFLEWWPVLVMSPGVAGVFAAHGMSKDGVRVELADRARVSARTWDSFPEATGVDGFHLPSLIEQGWAPAAYAESEDPDRLIPAIPFPDRLAIVVAGDPGRNQSRYFVNNHAQGTRVVRRAALASPPTSWSRAPAPPAWSARASSRDAAWSCGSWAAWRSAASC